MIPLLELLAVVIFAVFGLLLYRALVRSTKYQGLVDDFVDEPVESKWEVAQAGVMEAIQKDRAEARRKTDRAAKIQNLLRSQKTNPPKSHK